MSDAANRNGRGIGTLQENSLHASLKDWLAQPGDQLEERVGGYYIDIVRGDMLIEIQTRNFSAIRPKLTRLLDEGHPVHLVHPIALEKWIVRLPESGDEPLDRRKSPRRGRPEHLFLELVRLPHLISHVNFNLEILLTREEEIRRDDGRGSWRRKGWSIADRRLLEVVERIAFPSPESFRGFLPAGLPALFTSRDLSTRARAPRYLSGKMLYCLSKMGLVEVAGKRGRSNLYRTIP